MTLEFLKKIWQLSTVPTSNDHLLWRLQWQTDNRGNTVTEIKLQQNIDDEDGGEVETDRAKACVWSS